MAQEAAFNTRCTCTALHSPPLAVVIPRSFSAAAIWRNVDAPSARIAAMTGIRSAARFDALSRRALAEALLPFLATESIAQRYSPRVSCLWLRQRPMRPWCAD